MSTRKVAPALAELQRRRKALLRLLSRPKPLIVGSVVDVTRRCGNPSCHCAERPTHRQTLLLYGSKGRRTSKFVRKRDANRVRRAGDRYRDCKRALRELRTLNRKELQLLRAQIQLRSIAYE